MTKPLEVAEEESCWTCSEPGFEDLREALACAASGARAGLRGVLVLTILLTSATLLFSALTPPTFEASIVVRVTEHPFDEDTEPSPGELSLFVNELFLTRTTLLSLIEANLLYPDAMALGASVALEEMRNDIRVSVVQNYFSPERFVADPFRTARVVISYSGRSPELAFAVVHGLAERFSAERARLRREATNAATVRAKVARRALTDELEEVERNAFELRLSGDDSPAPQARLQRLSSQAFVLGQQLDVLSGRSTKLSLRDDLERGEMGATLEIIDAGEMPTRALERSTALTLVAAVAFLLSLPVAALAVGILPSRIHHPAAIERLGLPFAGRLWAPSNPNEEQER